MDSKTHEILAGVDSGTQSTKVVLVDSATGGVIGRGAAPHELIADLPPGHAEQHPQSWFEALQITLRSAIAAAECDPRKIAAIGVSGQQHGFVPLDVNGDVIRPAKLWCDTSTVAQCERLLATVGGAERYIALTGNGLPPGFTASKILWLREYEPEAYARLATVLLPHDYLNFRLTGAACMECGDASGTALFDVRRRAWCEEVIAALDPGLRANLPNVIDAATPSGFVRPELARDLGLREQVLVSAGGGDNMMSAIGTGNVVDGVVTVSLGTSGTIFAYSSQPIVDPRGEVAAFCDSTGAWLPLVCTMNATVATEWTKSLLGLSNDDLEQAVARVAPGSDGLMLIPYFDGERTPNVPHGSGVWFGANRRNNTPAHFARAAMEGVALGLSYGMRRLHELGIRPRELRLTGGGARSAAWRQIIADVFETPAACPSEPESAAYGAALQAAWCVGRARGQAIELADLAKRWVRLDEATRVVPNPAAAAHYRKLRALHDQVSAALRTSFTRHHEIAAETSAR